LLLVPALALAVGAWFTHGRPLLWCTAGVVTLVAVVGVLGLAGVEVGPSPLPVLLAGALAVAGGGPVTRSVFALVDRDLPTGSDGRRAGSMDGAGEVLRGGAWIGGLERAGAFAAVAAGWPEGVALVLGLKGLGRYSELKTVDADRAAVGGVAERFIIGTFVSVLWALACAGVAAVR